MRRGKTGASTKEARLEAVDGDVLAGSVSEIDGAVEALLGLTFEHFTRAVVLPQNEFARFLHDKPAATARTCSSSCSASTSTSG